MFIIIVGAIIVQIKQMTKFTYVMSSIKTILLAEACNVHIKADEHY